MATITVTPTQTFVSGNTVTPATLNQLAQSTVALTAGTVTVADLATATVERLLPAGAVMPFAMNSAPAGWLAANGAAVDRAGTYAALFAAIGTTHGAGNGSTTFNLPDLRGYFIRGFGPNGDGVASGTFAAKQGSSMLNHTHTGTTSSNGNHTHGNNSGAGITGVYVNWPGQNNLSLASGSGARTANFPVESEGDHTHTLTTGDPSAGGGTETRPANIALLYCIKF